LDQSTTTGKQHQTSYLGDGRLIGGRGVIFPGGHRVSRQRLLGVMRSAGKGNQTEEMTNPVATPIEGNT
jgi:hypothetical protein